MNFNVIWGELIAVYRRFNDVTELLIEKGANFNVVDNSQHSVLYYASKNGFTQIVEQLIMVRVDL